MDEAHSYVHPTSEEGLPPSGEGLSDVELSAMSIRALFSQAEALGVEAKVLDEMEKQVETTAALKTAIIALIFSAGGDALTPRLAQEAPDAKQALGHRSIRKKTEAVLDSLEALPVVFADLAGDDQLLRFEDFKEALVVRLHISLSEHEIERIWSRLVAERMIPTPNGVLDAKLTLDDFSHGVQNISFLRCCVQHLRTDTAGFSVPPWYDYSKSTNDNYGVPEADATLVGAYVPIRESRDYSYHTHYTPERQLWQDYAVKTVVSRTERQGNPWIVYTCGPMGAGKGFALSWMSRNGYFPLEDIVCIDPDHFKKMMPEWPQYVAAGGDAGTLCHRESGFLQEIAQEVAMTNSQNVWVDGSLRDGHWFAQVFKSIRRRFPHYKIAIFEVSASEEIVRERIKHRAEREGRDIPEHLIVQSLASVADSLNILMPLVDFVARICNSGPSPKLRAYIRVNADGNWTHIKRRFARPERAGSFPGSLAPLLLRCVSEPSFLLRSTASDSDEGSDTVVPLELDLGCSELASIRDAILEAKIVLSPGCPVTLSNEARTTAGIPVEATSFAFAYPVKMDWNMLPDLSSYTCESMAVMAGSFVYFDASGTVCGVNAVASFMEDDESEEGDTGQDTSALSPAKPLVQFCPPLPLPEASYQALKASGRLRPVTLAGLLHKGAFAFAWIKPGEQLNGLTAVPKAGAFAYVFRQSTLQSALASVIDLEDVTSESEISSATSSLSGTSKGTWTGYFPAVHEGCYFPVAL